VTGAVRRRPDPADDTVAVTKHTTSLSAERFKAAFRRHPAGVAIITAMGPDGPAGLTATSVSSISAEPPLFVFSLSTMSSATPTISEADTLMVHLLSASALDTAIQFATSGIDRFADTSAWTRAPGGEPVLLCNAARIHAKVIDRMSAGGSIVVAAHALAVTLPAEPFEPLVYFDRTWHSLSTTSQLR